MNIAKFFGILFLLFFVAGCSSGESKLQSILDRQIGRSKFVERTRLELDSILGKKDSKLKTSVLNFVADRVELKYTEIIIDGKRARVRVVANVPKMEEMSTFILLASFLPRETMLNMTIQDVLLRSRKIHAGPAVPAKTSQMKLMNSALISKSGKTGLPTLSNSTAPSAKETSSPSARLKSRNLF